MSDDTVASWPTFDLAGPLPGIGTTVLEASAGTGKTYAVAALATRFVAEDIAPLDRMLVITFSRAATQELRDRVRERFVHAAEALADPARARVSGERDIAVLTRAADGSDLSDDEVAVRRRRLLDAIANYDAATIATTHEFCHAVLRSLGVAGSLDATETLRDDLTELRDEVVDDRFLALYANEPVDPPVDYRTARNAARRAVESSHSVLRPIDREDPEAKALVAFAEEVRGEIELRKRRAGVFTFDDMLTRLAKAVAPTEDEPTPPAAERMRARWDVVLVDEFQDTDPVQWDVLRHAFSTGTRLVLIGDPKQAIYAFRGGDTPTYLRAVRDATVQTLGTNYRSDAAVVDALQALTRGAELGDERIRVHEVAAKRTRSSLSVGGGVRLRQVRRDGFALTKSGTINIGKVRDHIAADLAADIARQLAEGVTLDGRRLDPGDIAVLLHSVKDDAPRIQAELAKRGIPSVINSAESVMSSAAAQHWLRLLEAMEKPQLPGRIRAAALTPFFPDTPEGLLVDGDDRTDELAERIRSWLDLLRSRGVAAVTSAAHAAGLAPRVLGQQGGERVLTDLNHVGQLLHAAAQEHRLGISGLLVWLREAVSEGNRNDARRRRLDVDAKAVQFVTIHGSKGLEYPVVYLPQLFDRPIRDWPTVHAYHEGDVPCLDLADSPRAKAAARSEEAQEELRLAYVALTRARAQVVAWWAPTYNGPNGALTRLIFGRGPGDAIVPDRAAFGQDDDEADAVLGRWAGLGAFRVEASRVGDSTVELADPPAALSERTFDRDVDVEWRRTSYSGLIRAEELAGPAPQSEPEAQGTVDEDEPVEVPEVTEDADAGFDPGLLSPMNAMAGSATFGSLVHAVLEHTDPQAADLRAELLAKVEVERRWWSVPSTSEELADALLPMQHTSLGPLADNLTLTRIGTADRLCELDFEIPMAGGDLDAGPDRGLPLAAFADALRRHLPEDDPIRPYADKLEAPGLGDQVLRGYLSGSIDVVLRVPGSVGPRYVVVDYKTNTLGEPGRPQSAWDYAPDKVTASMLHSHYPLQSLLYSVVLHRYLRWRQPDYDPETHLGGVLYLYVRGMVGAETPEVDGVPCGVFSWRPPVALVLALSAILDGEADR
ncbi:exodeoxyribonuclease V subunit beta [Nocardioides marmoriginsengisoli]|uniref:RecBCD enzyme subunit RecB n=1 Tax=Nocardioides marmoriginsengisoli TaxID=661483 RepID=A0A3N0CB01_9ACTN|nr:UvrD-helicase domain-containing protein [Nocardioides marmoriginsengisoli]RNL60598.1 exodeoxyribonuclease V subunit beta [Nocardioides marmoriginsengisoli]